MADISGVLETLKSAAKDLAVPGKSSCNKLEGILEKLSKAVKDLANVVQKQSEEDKGYKDQARENADELDDYRQKNLKGKFVITASSKKPTAMKKQEELASEGLADLPAHIIQLAKDKYKVTLAPEDIASCHYLPKGGIFFSLWNLKPGSAFAELTKNIKEGMHPHINVYFNFMLTKRRSSLLYEVRQMKQKGRISRFYSDENGSISIKVNPKDKSKKLSSIHQTGSSKVKTYLNEELHAEVPEQPQQPPQQQQQQSQQEQEQQ